MGIETKGGSGHNADVSLARGNLVELEHERRHRREAIMREILAHQNAFTAANAPQRYDRLLLGTENPAVMATELNRVMVEFTRYALELAHIDANEYRAFLRGSLLETSR